MAGEPNAAVGSGGYDARRRRSRRQSTASPSGPSEMAGRLPSGPSPRVGDRGLSYSGTPVASQDLTVGDPFAAVTSVPVACLLGRRAPYVLAQNAFLRDAVQRGLQMTVSKSRRRRRWMRRWARSFSARVLRPVAVRCRPRARRAPSRRRAATGSSSSSVDPGDGEPHEPDV